MKLWVDDERIEPLGWVRCTTAENAIAVLQGGGVTELSLDHDLDTFVDTRNGESRELTGYDIAVWIEAACQGGRWESVPSVIRCHSANPVGAKRIMQSIAQIAKMREHRRFIGAVERAEKEIADARKDGSR